MASLDAEQMLGMDRENSLHQVTNLGSGLLVPAQSLAEGLDLKCMASGEACALLVTRTRSRPFSSLSNAQPVQDWISIDREAQRMSCTIINTDSSTFSPRICQRREEQASQLVHVRQHATNPHYQVPA